MPRTLLFFCLLCCGFAFSPLAAHAQPVADIRPLLKALTSEQKHQLTQLLRHLGASADEDIQHAYRFLPEEHKRQVLDLLDFFRYSNRQEQLAEVVWSPDTLFLGEMVEGTVRIDSFRVTNIGRHPYWIRNTRATCDCTVIYAPGYPIMPGTSATLRVEFNSRAKLGHSRPVIVVYDNSEPNMRHILHIKAHVLSRQSIRFPWDR